MKIIVSKTNDPFFNIASEEYILKNYNEDIFFLYINNRSVIIGKHQNPIAETNYSFITENNIPIIRRLSGGGAVYHDLGNLNFCFVQTADKHKLVDFKKFTQPIIEVLISLGLNASLGVKNDIRINNIKVSGNAEHIWKNRVIHHGTLLFDTELNHLNQVLSKDDNCFTGKSVKSNRSEVTNIINYLSPPIKINDLSYQIINHLSKFTNIVIEHSFTTIDIEEIRKLSEKKYSTWEWNYGYTSDYQFNGKFILNNKMEEIELIVKKGIIESVIISNYNQKEILDYFIGKPHSEILNRLIFK